MTGGRLEDARAYREKAEVPWPRDYNPLVNQLVEGVPSLDKLADCHVLEIMSLVIPPEPVTGATDLLANPVLVENVFETVVSLNAAAVASGEEVPVLAVAATGAVWLCEREATLGENVVELIVSQLQDGYLLDFEWVFSHYPTASSRGVLVDSSR